MSTQVRVDGKPCGTFGYELDRAIGRLNPDWFQVEQFPLASRSDGRRHLAKFGRIKDSAAWYIQLNSAFSEVARLEAFHRIVAAANDPTHAYWSRDGHEYGAGLVLLADETGLSDRSKAPGDAASRMTRRIAELVEAELKKVTPSLIEWTLAEIDRDEWSRERLLRSDLHLHLSDEAYIAMVAREIRAEMARQDRTITGLAEVLNLTPATVRRITKGMRPLRVAELEQISNWLDVDVEHFFNGPGVELIRADLTSNLQEAA